MCESERHAPTPVGEPCAQRCGAAIGAHDRGFLIPLLAVDREPLLLAHHLWCFLRSLGLPGEVTEQK